VSTDPLYAEALQRFAELLEEARASGDPEPTAMTLATASPDGRVSARTVLLKEVDERGFVFYTNTASRKGRQLELNPQAALLFLWKTLRNQVQAKIEGAVEPVTASEADAYFASRPYISQIGAWASLQSETLDSRETLDRRVAHFQARYPEGEVPRPSHWSGYRLQPTLIELWFGEAFRLHQRDRYEVEAGRWTRRLLFP
jgi:pyridoxamine 5'-phosphate oxidase